jgi:integral membrane sensor domain MASE1
VTIYSVIAILGVIAAAVLGAVVGGTFAGIFGVRSLPSIVANQVLSFAVGVLIMSLTPSALLSIYYDLKLRREGTDLAQRVQALPIR